MVGTEIQQKKWVELLATFFYLGKFPKAPGTIGTLGAIPLAYLLMVFGSLAYVSVTIVFILFSIYIAQAYEKRSEQHDCKEVVIDEVAGYLVAVALLPISIPTLLFGFLLFRFFDILKPFPISHFDKNVSGGFGVVIDDVVAGFICNIILQLTFRYFPESLQWGLV